MTTALPKIKKDENINYNDKKLDTKIIVEQHENSQNRERARML